MRTPLLLSLLIALVTLGCNRQTSRIAATGPTPPPAPRSTAPAPPPSKSDGELPTAFPDPKDEFGETRETAQDDSGLTGGREVNDKIVDLRQHRRGEQRSEAETNPQRPPVSQPLRGAGPQEQGQRIKPSPRDKPAAATEALGPARFTVRKKNCYGTDCPRYALSLHGERTLFLDAERGTKRPGKQTRRLSYAELEELTELLDEALANDGQPLAPSYPADAADLLVADAQPTLFVYPDREGEYRETYVFSGAPEALARLLARVEELALDYGWLPAER